MILPSPILSGDRTGMTDAAVHCDRTCGVHRQFTSEVQHLEVRSLARRVGIAGALPNAER
jgi:hypothetical protein